MLEDIIDNVDHKNGIYFSICYDKTEEKDIEFIDAQNLANILYFVYSLKTAGFDIIVGYTFLNSILFAMLDCEYTSSGWFNNIRKFSKDRFEEITSMGRRKKRYTSLPLLTYITFDMPRLTILLILFCTIVSFCHLFYLHQQKNPNTKIYICITNIDSPY